MPTTGDARSTGENDTTEVSAVNHTRIYSITTTRDFSVGKKIDLGNSAPVMCAISPGNGACFGNTGEPEAHASLGIAGEDEPRFFEFAEVPRCGSDSQPHGIGAPRNRQFPAQTRGLTPRSG